MDPTHASPPEPDSPRPAPTLSRALVRYAQSAAIHVAHLVWPAAVYVGATALDLIYVARLGLLRRSRATIPHRADEFEAQMTRLKEQRSRRWSPWKALPAGRRIEIRCAAAVLAAAAILGLRAYLTGPGSAAATVAHQSTTAHPQSAPSVRSDALIGSTASPRGAASTASTSTPPSASDQMRIDAEHFKIYRKQAAAGQWIVFGVEPMESASAHLADAQAQTKAAEAATTAACHWLYEPNAAASDEKRDACHQAEDRSRAMQAAEVAAQNALHDARNPVVRPVLTRGEVDQWDGFKVTSPVVIKDGNRYRMWYVGCRFIFDDYTCGIGHAQSSDGISWEKSPGPVLKVDDPVVSQDLHSITLAVAGDQYLLWYEIDANPIHGNDCVTLYLATSKDGLEWKPQGLVASGNCWENARLWPSSFSDGKTLHLWYSDYGSTDDGLLVHLVSADGKNWQSAGAPCTSTATSCVSSDGKNWHQAASTDIGTLGMDPRRMWVTRDAAGYRALFAHPDHPGYFGVLQSADGNSWEIAGGAPDPAKPAGGNAFAQFTGGDDGVPVTPAAIAEADGTWMWFAVPNTRDGSERIAVVFQKAVQR